MARSSGGEVGTVDNGGTCTERTVRHERGHREGAPCLGSARLSPPEAYNLVRPRAMLLQSEAGLCTNRLQLRRLAPFTSPDELRKRRNLGPDWSAGPKPGID